MPWEQEGDSSSERSEASVVEAMEGVERERERVREMEACGRRRRRKKVWRFCIQRREYGPPVNFI